MKKFKIPNIVRECVNMITTGCVSITIGHIIAKALPENLGRFGRIATCVGSFVIGDIIANKAAKYSDDSQTELEEAVNSVIEIVEKTESQKEMTEA